MLPPPPDPIQIDEVDEWEVEEILDSRISTDDDGEKCPEGVGSWAPINHMVWLCLLESSRSFQKLLSPSVTFLAIHDVTMMSL
jgi:hypothetical protein